MRISDIDTIRGDAQAQKPFVAFAPESEPPVLVDPAEPYGEEPKEVVALVELTPDERQYIHHLLRSKRKAIAGTFNCHTLGPSGRSKTMKRLEEIDSLIDKFKS